MTSQTAPIQFPPGERASQETIRRQSRLLAEMDLLRLLYDAVNEIVLILNSQRQIVFCNRHLADLLGLKEPSLLHGLRPGEALHCTHACQADDGCGASDFCVTCGAVQAILASQNGQGGLQECRILRGEGGEALDLLVRTTPLEVAGESFTVFAVTDISHLKRRRALERVFFHDLMNTATGVKMLAESLQSASDDKAPELAAAVTRAARQLIEEITCQRDLISAESHELSVWPVHIRARAFLQDLVETYAQLAAGRGCRLAMDSAGPGVSLRSDHTILSRVVGNMIKNAVEACRPGLTVTVGCRQTGGRIEFHVHNPGAMTRDVQLQVFNRSFSTKGEGRGLGTYSMKLLTERYLKGEVSFTSGESEGTTFTVSCPPDITRADAAGPGTA